MRSLLDINVLIALVDGLHVFHDQAHKWWAAHASEGWASCPLTENGFVRIMSNPAYSREVRFTPSELIARLRSFASQTDHEFWSDDISLRDGAHFDSQQILGSRRLTDIYLLALAVNRKGRLATFDQTIPLTAVKQASDANLCPI